MKFISSCTESRTQIMTERMIIYATINREKCIIQHIKSNLLGTAWVVNVKQSCSLYPSTVTVM